MYVDFNLSHEEIWRQTRGNHRLGIHKLIREGLEVTFNDSDLFDEYIIYLQKMKRVGAKEFYCFSGAYFEDLFSTHGEKFNLVCVLSPSGEIACGGLFSAYNGIIQVIFSGTHESYLRFSPSKLMIDFLRCWGMDHNFKLLHLGGGVGASTDQLLHFKADFSCLRGAYSTLRVVFDHELYRELNQNVQNLNNLECDDNGYSPLYRKPFYLRMTVGEGNAKTQSR